MAKPIHILTAGSDNEPVAAFKNRADAEAAYDAINAWFSAMPKMLVARSHLAWIRLAPCCMVDYLDRNVIGSSDYLNLDIKETVLLSKFK